LSIIRLIEEEALKDKTSEVHVQLPVDMATFLMNEKRDFIVNIEKRHGVHVIVIANPYLHSPQYKISRLKEDNVGKNKKPSYLLVQQPELELVRSASHALINQASVTADHPQVAKQKALGFFKLFWNTLTGNKENLATIPINTLLSVEQPLVEKRIPEKKNTGNRSKRTTNSSINNNSHPRGVPVARKKVATGQPKS
jgi:ribonuclease E